MTAPEAYDAVVKPMVAMFPAPTHLRHNPEALNQALGLYVRALESYDRAVLEKAWQRVAANQTWWCWPTPAELKQTAEEIHRQTHPAQQAEAWVEKAEALADAYVRRFMLTITARKAREGGYERELKAFVRAAAWVQAEYIVGRHGVGYESAVLFPGRERDQEAEERFFTKAKEQAETGHIKVVLPPGMVKGWQGEAKGRERTR